MTGLLSENLLALNLQLSEDMDDSGQAHDVSLNGSAQGGQPIMERVPLESSRTGIETPGDDAVEETTVQTMESRRNLSQQTASERWTNSLIGAVLVAGVGYATTKALSGSSSRSGAP